MPTLEAKMPVIEKNFNNIEASREWLKSVSPQTKNIKIVVSDEPEIDPAYAFLNDIENIAVDTGIKDLAENHDHYLHGLPKNK